MPNQRRKRHRLQPDHQHNKRAAGKMDRRPAAVRPRTWGAAQLPRRWTSTGGPDRHG